MLYRAGVSYYDGKGRKLEERMSHFKAAVEMAASQLADSPEHICDSL